MSDSPPKRRAARGDPVSSWSVPIRIAVSARHAHLCRDTLDKLFGAGHELQVHAWLSQVGQFAAEETVTLIGRHGRLEHVRVVGPPRAADQVEVSRSDAMSLGIQAPVRMSGNLAATPGVAVEGPAGRVDLTTGLIVAHRHVHASPEEARRLGLHDGDLVRVKVDSDGRDLVFSDVTVRIAPDFRLELHLDTDEANAAGVQSGDFGDLLLYQRSR